MSGASRASPRRWPRCRCLRPKGWGLGPASGPSHTPWCRGPLQTAPRSSQGWAPACSERTWGDAYGPLRTQPRELPAWIDKQIQTCILFSSMCRLIWLINTQWHNVKDWWSQLGFHFNASHTTPVICFKSLNELHTVQTKTYNTFLSRPGLSYLCFLYDFG
jgi:hypothetical protein